MAGEDPGGIEAPTGHVDVNTGSPNRLVLPPLHVVKPSTPFLSMLRLRTEIDSRNSSHHSISAPIIKLRTFAYLLPTSGKKKVQCNGRLW